MKILDATFIVKDGERGTFVVEFAYSTEMVRVWNRGDFGDGSAKPLLERVNAKRRFKPCATHVAELLALALHKEPPTQFGKNRAAAVARDADVAKAARQRQTKPKLKMVGGPT